MRHCQLRQCGQGLKRSAQVQPSGNTQAVIDLLSHTGTSLQPACPIHHTPPADHPLSNPPAMHAGISEPMQVAETFTFQLQPDHAHSDAEQQPGAAEAAKASGAKLPAGGEQQHADSKAAADQQKAGASDKAAAAAAVEGPACEDGSCGPSLMDVARLDTCVTVVDAATFFANVESIEDLKDRCVGGWWGGVWVGGG